jgi:hypothetical protein
MSAVRTRKVKYNSWENKKSTKLKIHYKITFLRCQTDQETEKKCLKLWKTEKSVKAQALL